MDGPYRCSGQKLACLKIESVALPAKSLFVGVNMYLFLFAVMLIALVAALKLADFDLLSPAPLMILGLTMSVMLAGIGGLFWNDVPLKWNAVYVVVVGTSAILVGQLIANCKNASQISGELPKFQDSTWKYVVLFALILVAIVVRVVETSNIASDMGLGDVSYAEKMEAVRHGLDAINSSEGLKLGVGFSFVERQLEKLVLAIGYVSSALVGYSLVKSDRRSIALSVGTLLLCGIHVLVCGGRGQVVYYVVSAFASFSLFKIMSGERPKVVLKKLVIVGTITGAVGIVVFYLSSFLIGRTVPVEGASASPLNRLESGQCDGYIVDRTCMGTYIHGILDNPELISSASPGVKTFYYLFGLPFKFGLIDEYPSYSLAWVHPGGNGSNIFTGFARSYFDFGPVGMVTLTALACFAVTWFYGHVKSSGTLPLVSIFCLMSGYLFDFAREEYVFSRMLSLNGLANIVVIVLVALFMSRSFESRHEEAGAVSGY